MLPYPFTFDTPPPYNSQPTAQPPPAPPPTPTTTTAQPPTATFTARKALPCPYACPDPNNPGAIRTFSGKHNLDQHVREKHTLTRPYKCTICGDQCRGFNRPWGLNRHMRMIHKVEVGPGRGGHRGVKQQQQQQQQQSLAEQDVDELFGLESGDGSAFGPSDTFADERVRCFDCEAEFGNRESMFEHLHAAHGMETSPFCGCLMCGFEFRQGDSEAGRLRGLLREGGGVGVETREREQEQPGGYALAPLLADEDFNTTQSANNSPAVKDGDLAKALAEHIFNEAAAAAPAAPAETFDENFFVAGGKAGANNTMPDFPPIGDNFDFGEMLGLHGQDDEFGGLMRDLDEMLQPGGEGMPADEAFATPDFGGVGGTDVDDLFVEKGERDDAGDSGTAADEFGVGDDGMGGMDGLFGE